jgi:hypothetical protein
MNTEFDHRVALLKHIAPHQSATEREKMWDEILQTLLSWWGRHPQYPYGFSLAFDALIPELSDAQRARIPREIWETRLTQEHHYRLPWKYLPQDLFNVAWKSLQGIREDDVPSLIEHFVRYAPDHIIPMIEPEVEKLSGNRYSGDRLPRLKTMLIRRNLRLSKAERDAAYIDLVRQYINRYQLSDLLDYIPQELMLQVWWLKLTDFRDSRLNKERKSSHGPYRVEETLRSLIPRLPVSAISQALDSLLEEVLQENTLWESSLDPKTTSELSKDLLRRLPETQQNHKTRELAEKVEKRIHHILDHRPEQYYGSFPSLYGYLIRFVDSDFQDKYWRTFFEFTTLLPNHPRQASVIVEHLEHYPVAYRLEKWGEALQIVKENPQDAEWVLNGIIGAIPLVFGEQPFPDQVIASDIAHLLLNTGFVVSEYGFDEDAWFGLALLIQAFKPDIVELLFEKYKSRRIKRVAACAFMTFLAPEQIDQLLVHRREGAEGAMYMYHPDKGHLLQLSLIVERWTNSTALVVWKRSLDKLEQYVSEHESNYHPDFFINWFQVLAATMPHYDVVAAWMKLLDHRKVFWFDAWEGLGAILIENLQPVSDEEAIRIIWRDIQEMGKDTVTLQSAIAPKLPTDIVNKLRDHFTTASLPPNDVFVCSLPMYIYYGYLWTQQNGRTSNKISKFSKLLLWLIAIINSLLYPVVYLYMTLSKITKPVHRYISTVTFILLFPLLLVFSAVEQVSYRVSRLRFVSSPFWLMRSLVRGTKGRIEPVLVLEIVKAHQLPKSISEQCFEELLRKADLSDFASARPLLQRVGGGKLRYTAHRAYQDAIEWWAGATIEK